MTSEQTIRRSDILNTQVVTKDARRLGIVSQVWIDVDQREVVAFSLRDSLISVSGIPRYMYLDRVTKIGDVILVENEDAIEDIDVDAYSNLVNWEVITETGEALGRVRGFKFDTANGKILSIVIASLGIPQVPEQVLSTYEISVEEIVSTGPNRLIVFEGAEERLTQLSVGLLERLGIGKAPWDRDGEDEYYSAPKTIAPANQLPSGVPLEPPMAKVRTPERVKEPVWDEDDYEPEPPRRQVMEARSAESIRYPEDNYDDYEDEGDNWAAIDKDEYQKEPENDTPVFNSNKSDFDDDDLDQDVWEEDEAPKPIIIPEKVKQKQPEYEEEGY
ncbi:PRC-barrel domain-containing protein [Calothrix sp. UHCC 0171]|uniref:PRC-barrel domain-containing protein n=1 Tax=Calothrix sp. UHCC 0171 TaxID=3110245 RepID=UPI002B21B3AF|nr:PRC-barrel domain-containing protein [Calothrix sp. UHCC 0171]MEA5573753.1 PRC-barrel domain-containing protein [Calothrix sp. UHCC 0171]